MFRMFVVDSNEATLGKQLRKNWRMFENTTSLLIIDLHGTTQQSNSSPVGLPKHLPSNTSLINPTDSHGVHSPIS